MKVVSVTNSTTIVVVRGYHNTTAATHSDATLIYELDEITDGFVISYYAEPDKLSAIDSSTSIDIENALQPALIDYVKSKALMDAAASETDPNKAQIKMAAAQQALSSYRETVKRFASKKNDKIGGTRAVVPANLS